MTTNGDASLDSGTAGPKPVRRLQTDVRTLIVLVACCGAILWAWRHLSENNDPVLVEVRAIQKRAIGALKSGKPAERVAAIVDLAGVHTGDSSVAIAPLTVALEDADTGVRVAAANALGSTGSAVLKSGSGGEAVRASATALIGCLKDPEPSVRFAAASSLGAINLPKFRVKATPPIDYKAVTDALAEALGDRDAGVRRAAIVALGSQGGDPPAALALGLKDESAENRVAAVIALTHARQRGLDPWLLILLRLAEHDPDPSVREQCFNALSYWFKPPAITVAVVPVLIASLANGDAKVRSLAASLLGELQADAVAAIPELLRVLNEPLDPGVIPLQGPSGILDPGCAAATALGRIAPASPKAKEVIAALMQVARSGPFGRRGWAAYGLGDFGPAAEEAVPVLIEVINDTSPDPTSERPFSAAMALGKIAVDTPSAERAVAGMLPVLRSKDWIFRVKVIEALSRFGPRAAAAVPAIRALKDDREMQVRNAAAKALLAIENKSAS